METPEQKEVPFVYCSKKLLVIQAYLLTSNTLIIGHKRHGKDYLCELLVKHVGIGFISSSKICAEKFIFDLLKDTYGYSTVEECHADRDNRRPLWFQGIRIFNYHDKAALSKLIFENTDIYNGLRNDEEFFEAERQGIYDLKVWVDASKVKELEPITSMNLKEEYAEFTFDNNAQTPEAAMTEFVRLLDWVYDNKCQLK